MCGVTLSSCVDAREEAVGERERVRRRGGDGGQVDDEDARAEAGVALAAGEQVQLAVVAAQLHNDELRHGRRRSRRLGHYGQERAGRAAACACGQVGRDVAGDFAGASTVPVCILSFSLS